MRLPNEKLNRGGYLSIRRQPEAGACPTCGAGNGVPGYLRLDVPAHHPQYGQIVPCPDCHSGKMRQLKIKRAQSNRLEGDLADCTFDNYLVEYGDQVALDAAKRFADAPQYWLTLHGGYGRGKTHLLAAIHNSLIGRGIKSYFCEFPDLTSQLRQAVAGNYAEDFYQKISQYPVLIIDEIDKSDLQHWTREQSFRLFNRRNNLKSETGTVLAMNQAPDGNGDLAYLFSRMADTRNECIKVQGRDNRGVVSLLRELSGLS